MIVTNNFFFLLDVLKRKFKNNIFVICHVVAIALGGITFVFSEILTFCPCAGIPGVYGGYCMLLLFIDRL